MLLVMCMCTQFRLTPETGIPCGEDIPYFPLSHLTLPSLPPSVRPSLSTSLRPFLPLSIPLSLPPSPPPCRVAVGWFGGSCHSCQSCAEGDHILCDNGTITGATIDGGYQQYTFAKSDSLAAVPDSLTFQEAAPLVCAGWCIRLR